MRLITSLALAAALGACSAQDAAEPNAAELDTSEAAAASPVEAVPSPDAQVPEAAPSPAITLLAFPDLPEPPSSLSETDAGQLTFPTSSPYDFEVLLNDPDAALPTTGLGDLTLPEGASAAAPVPAMVILHGSGGITEGREQRYVDLFASLGVAAFVVDYYTPRGVTAETPYGMKTMAATEVDVIADAYAALSFLQGHPAIDPERIGVIGFSYGGMATRYTMDDRLKDLLAPDAPGFALHIDTYGPCHQDTGHWGVTGAPYLAVYGDNDNSVDPAACAVVQERLRENGAPVEVLIIEGAGHAWENSAPQVMGTYPYIRGCTFSYDPEGRFTINGELAPAAPMGAGRQERAQYRAGLAAMVDGCIGIGYLIGSDPDTDAKAKAAMTDFMRRHFGLTP